MTSRAKKTSTSKIVDLITTEQDQKFASAGRMATAIVEIIQSQGTCSAKDLYEKGFSTAEVFQYWHMAQSIASVEINLMSKSKSSARNIMRRE